MAEETLTKGDRTRTEIIRAAHRLFLDQGYHGTSMRQVAQEAGIAVGGIYNHFPGKEEVFVAVLEAYHPYHNILPAIQQARGETMEAFIRDAANAMVRELDRQPDFLNLLFVEIVEFNSRHASQLFASIYPKIMPLMKIFQEKHGELRLIPLPNLFRAFLGLFFSYVITGRLLKDQLPPEINRDSLQNFVDIFLHGILAETSQDGGAAKRSGAASLSGAGEKERDG
jgi:AcrR family transcriptional regulator